MSRVRFKSREARDRIFKAYQSLLSEVPNKILIDAVLDRFTDSVVGAFVRAGRQPNNQIFSGDEANMIAGFGNRRDYFQGAVTLNGNIHENIKSCRDGIGIDAELFHILNQVILAAGVILALGIEHLKHLQRTWGH